MKTRFVVVMGVAGSGKTTVSRALAERLGWRFYDGDDFHTSENVAKMANGMPLDDVDREPWLEALHEVITSAVCGGTPGVLACSALKESYRDHLVGDRADVALVFLRGDYDLLRERMSARPEHFMGPDMLRSQFEDLEEPAEALVVDASLPAETIVDVVVKSLA